MSPLDLLSEARAAGLVVTTDGDKLLIRGPKRADALARQLLAQKAEVLPLLTTLDVTQPPRPAQPAVDAMPWDAAAADRLLAEFRYDLAQLERERFHGQFFYPFSAYVADGLALAEGYVVNHQQEAARGWDSVELLRDLVTSTLRTVRGYRPPIQAERTDE
jgi:hypothetical protein